LILNTFQRNINAIAAALHLSGMTHAVICPGSRNAPLVMAFHRHSSFKMLSVTDERAAGFVALGLAKSSRLPVAVICTSGSALANIYPAVLEAYYMQIPLVVISADRPKHMIDRWDGQTIHQNGIFGTHVKSNCLLPDSHTEDLSIEISQLCQEAYFSAIQGTQGPVHINVPMDEPLYEAVNSEMSYPHLVQLSFPQSQIYSELPNFEELKKYNKVLILLGADADIDVELQDNIQNKQWVVLSDIISNSRVHSPFKNWEACLLNANEKIFNELKPDLLITFGKMVLNKPLKQLFRSHPPKVHIHVDENGYCADPFFTQARVWKFHPNLAMKQILNEILTNIDYFNSWQKFTDKKHNLKQVFESFEYSEIKFLHIALNKMEENVVLHLANSMSVRYVAYLAETLNPKTQVYSNRGVSGIDGCTSTAIGMAFHNNKENVLITGDLAFLYDINSFFQQSLPKNLKIIVLNNAGGGIFKMIKGPSDMREFDPFLLTPQHYDLSKAAELYGLDYFEIKEESEIENQLNGFFNNTNICILNVKTDLETNTKVFKQFKNLYE
jgi:2-succinyl-5-enolpyruvyl-6-hydroxy-3-cyclohexene-1-carboxylate synthase